MPLRCMLLFSAMGLNLFSPLHVVAVDEVSQQVIERARAAISAESTLENIVTLIIEGEIEPIEDGLMSAQVRLIARKPCSQRLEVRMDDLLETTLLHGDNGSLIRTHITEGISRMRELTDAERSTIRHSTQNLFNFFRPALRDKEVVTYKGRVKRHNTLCDILVYNCEDGSSTVRYFSKENGDLISTIRKTPTTSLEIVEEGEFYAEGVKFPARQFYYQDGKPLHRFEIKTIQINKALASGTFRMPEPKK